MGKISFNNFKAFGEKPQTFSSKPITLIYGPNSIGKSSLLHGLLYFFYTTKNGEISPKDTTFAGDKVDFGGFKNFIHNHQEDGKITYEFTYSDIDEISKILGINLKEMRKINPYAQSLTEEIIEEKIAKYNKIHIIKFDDIVNYLQTVEIFKTKSKRRFLGFFYDKEHNMYYSEYSMQLGKILLDMHNYAYVDLKNIYKKKDGFKSKLRNIFRKIELIDFIHTILDCEKILKKILNPNEDTSELNIRNKDGGREFLKIIDTEYQELYSENDDFIKFCTEFKVFSVEDIVETIRKIEIFSKIENITLKLDLKNKKKTILVDINNLPWLEIDYDGKVKIHDENILAKLSKEDLLPLELENLNSIGKIIIKSGGTSSSKGKKAVFLKEDIEYPMSKLNISPYALLNNINRYFSELKLQYFSPLRYYPDRDKLKQQIAKQKNKKDIKKYSIFNFLNQFLAEYIVAHTFHVKNKYNIFIKIMHIPMMDLSEVMKKAIIIDSLNKISFINIKQKETSTAKNIWDELIRSKFGIEKLNNWFSDDKKLRTKYKIAIKENKKTKELKFIDLKNDIEVTPRDMGLGVSQVLPILVASQNFQDTTLFLEQPELHLHPAVQCELADEFIKSARESGNRFYIETHSEHLLLRIMKRLRYSDEGRLKEDDPLYLTPSDICLLYVDNNGKTTYIKELELDKDGSLLDAWPNGFFEEGYKERFE